MIREQINQLIAAAEQESGRSGLTTHEAKEHFRRHGKESVAHRLHLLLCDLAGTGSDRTPSPLPRTR